MKRHLIFLILIFLSLPIFGQICNDECSSATLITLEPEGFGMVYQAFYEMYTVSYTGGNSCSLSPSEDAWYKFSASTSNVKLTLSNNNSLVTLYNNSCNSLIDYDCSESPIDLFTGLDVGTIYYLKIQKRNDSGGGIYEFKLEEYGSPLPSNPKCTNSIPATVGSGSCGPDYNASNLTATSHANSHCSSLTYDLWYTITAPTSGAIEIETDANSLSAAIYKNGCLILTDLDCTQSISEDPFLRGMIGGQTYQLRIGSNVEYAGYSYTFCMKKVTVPTNENCSNSETIAINSSCTEIHSFDTRLSQNKDDGMSCTEYQKNEDFWYDFIAPLNGSIIIDNESGLFNFSLYSSTCSNLIEIRCGSINSSEEKSIGGLTPGNSYKLKIAHSYIYHAPINFCIYEGAQGPVNEDCSSAIPLNVNFENCDNSYDQAWKFATFSGQNSECYETENVDAWFTFTSPSTGDIEFSGSTETTKSIYSGTCGSLNLIVCVDGDIISGLPPNQTFYLQLTKALESTNSTICLIETDFSLAHDDCSGAIVLLPAEENLTSAYMANYSNENSCDEFPHDFWYTFTAPTTGDIEVDVYDDTGNLPENDYYVGLFEGTCGSLSNVSCQRVSPSSNVFADLIPGNQYYLQVYAELHRYQLSVFTDYEIIDVPTNNKCSDPTSIQVVSSCIPVNFVDADFRNATLSTVSNPSCFNDEENRKDLWYSFTTTSNNAVQFNNSINHFGYIIIYEDNCGSLTEVLCSLASNDLRLSGLSPNTNYLMRLLFFYNANFEICLSEAPIDDNNCSNPTNVLVGEEGCGPLKTLEFDNLDPVETPICGEDIEYWYEFEAPSSGDLFFQNYEGSNISLSVYQNICSNLDELLCVNTNPGNHIFIEGLTSGQTYLLRVASTEKSATLSFCLKASTSPIPNSSCISASSISTSVDETCNNTVSGSTLNTSESIGDLCGSNIANAVFYSFTAPSSDHFLIQISNNAATHKVAVFNDCVLQNPLSCGLMETLATLTSGNTYIIAISPEDNDLRSSFDLCIYKPDPSLSNGSVGVNLSNPQARLDVNGGIKPGFTDNALAGNIRWNSDLEVYDGGNWQSLVGWDHLANQAINMQGLRIQSLADPNIAQDAATKAYVDLHTDGDSDSANEMQTISKTGSTVTLSNSGGSFTDAVDDSDNDPTNEIETWSTLVGIPTGFADNTDNVKDADSDAQNELQTISKNNNTVTLSNGGGSFIDNVNDADASTSNEAIASLKLTSTKTLQILEGGNIITESLSSLDNGWIKDGNDDLSYTSGSVLIGGSGTPSQKLEIASGGALITKNSSLSNPQLELKEDSNLDGARLRFSTTNSTNHWTLYGNPNNTASLGDFYIYHPTGGNILQMKGDGEVGIMGVPNADLHVYHGNNVGLDGFKMENNTNGKYFKMYVSSSSGDLRFYSQNQGNTFVAAIDDVTGAYTAFSDRRMKKDFADLHFDWKSFMELKPLNYRFKNDPDQKLLLGFVAQDMKKVYPELVNYDQASDKYHMDYPGIGVVSLKATQELYKENKRLENVLNEQQQLLNAQQAIIEKLIQGQVLLEASLKELSVSTKKSMD